MPRPKTANLRTRSGPRRGRRSGTRGQPTTTDPPCSTSVAPASTPSSGCGRGPPSTSSSSPKASWTVSRTPPATNGTSSSRPRPGRPTGSPSAAAGVSRVTCPSRSAGRAVPPTTTSRTAAPRRWHRSRSWSPPTSRTPARSCSLEPVWATSVWYRWTATTRRPVVIDGCDIDDPAEIHVYTGGTSIRSRPWRAESTVRHVLDTDTDPRHHVLDLTRRLRASINDGPGAGHAAVRSSIRELDPPDNDDFRHAEVIPTEWRTAAHDRSATAPTRPPSAASPATQAASRPGRSGTATRPPDPVSSPSTPAAGGLRIGEVLAVYTGEHAAPTRPGDRRRDRWRWHLRWAPGGVKVSFPARAGTTYLIAYDGNDGPFHLTVQ